MRGAGFISLAWDSPAALAQAGAQPAETRIWLRNDGGWGEGQRASKPVQASELRALPCIASTCGAVLFGTIYNIQYTKSIKYI